MKNQWRAKANSLLIGGSCSDRNVAEASPLTPTTNYGKTNYGKTNYGKKQFGAKCALNCWVSQLKAEACRYQSG